MPTSYSLDEVNILEIIPIQLVFTSKYSSSCNEHRVVLIDCTRPSSTAAFIVEIQTIWTRSDYNEQYVGTSSIPIISSWSNYQLPKRSEYILISENNVDLICSRSDVFIKPEFGIIANFDTYKPEEKDKIKKAFAKFMCSPGQ